MKAKSQKPKAKNEERAFAGQQFFWIPFLTSGLLLAFGFWLLASAAFAQEPQNAFVPQESVARTELPSGPLIYIAYSFVWAAVLVYVLMLWRRIGRVEREMAELSRRVSGK